MKPPPIDHYEWRCKVGTLARYAPPRPRSRRHERLAMPPGRVARPLAWLTRSIAGVVGLSAVVAGTTVLAAALARADAAPAILGSWGSADACAAHRAGKPDTAELGPYEIGAQWIRRWEFYCYAGDRGAWVSTEADIGHWRLQVVCGEGVTPRAYDLQLALQEDDLLVMTWQMLGEPDSHVVGPLERCELAPE